MDHHFEHLPHASSGLPLHMTPEEKEAVSELAQYEDITEEQKDEFLALLWEIACCATLIHFGIHPVQSIVGKREALSTHKDKDSVK